MLYPLPASDTLFTPEPTIRPELRVRVPARFTVPVALNRFRVAAVRVVPELAVKSVAPFSKITPAPTLMDDEMVIAPEPTLLIVKFPPFNPMVSLMDTDELLTTVLSPPLAKPAFRISPRVPVEAEIAPPD
jgi:hypothetical protein